MSPTYTMDAAQVLEGLIAAEARGVFHAANAGSCTWYEFACKVIELAGIDARVEAISSSEYPTKARRPVNSALRSDRLERVIGAVPRPWELALNAYLRERGHTQ